jgi:hypothetical protein
VGLIEVEVHLAYHLPLVVHSLEVHLDSSLVVLQTSMVTLVVAHLNFFLVHLDFSSMVEPILPSKVGLEVDLMVDPKIEPIAMVQYLKVLKAVVIC